MTPLEKAKAEKGRVNYCDECESFVILNDAPYCKADGKLIHPIMLVRVQGTGPAWNCKKRIKPITNYDLLIRRSPEEMATFLTNNQVEVFRRVVKEMCNLLDVSFPYEELTKEVTAKYEEMKKEQLEWLKQEADNGEN